MKRHDAASTMSWPIEGASTGTAMNTVMASDITLAMRRPS